MPSILAAISLASLLAIAPPAHAPSPARALAPAGANHPSKAHAGPRARVVAAARTALRRDAFRGDCSGFVRRVFLDARIPLPLPSGSRGGTEFLARHLSPTRRPQPGDLAYFHRTYDRDRPGLGRNLFTHIAVVEAVRGQRVSLIHRSNTAVRRLTLDLSRPGDPRRNDELRRKRPGDRQNQRYLASQLLGGFASPWVASHARGPRVASARR